MPKIKDIPKIDRPREKFLAKGSDALSKSELLAILIGSGIKGKNVKKLSEQIIKKYNNKFLDLTIDNLLAISGIGKAKALQIISSLALVKRFYDEKKPQENLILTAKDAITLNSDLKGKKKEHLVCLYLNARNALLKKEIISIGTLDKSLIHPREIFGPAVELRSAGIILLHNHPSGDPSPSAQDEEVFEKIIEAGKIMGVNVLDFIIIGDNKNYSFLKHLQKKKQDFYIADGVQFSLLDLLIDKKNEYVNSESGTPAKNKILDLFAGIGGIKIGFEKAGFECVFSNDFDKYCKITYDFNFAGKQKTMALGDISKISSNIIPNFDILTGRCK